MALNECTAFELIELLASSGWSWLPWRQRSSRPKSLAPIPAGYIVGTPKVWYSTRCVSQRYLALLIQSEAFFERGLEMVPHGCDDVIYKRILNGDFACIHGVVAEISKDIDDGGLDEPEVAGGALLEQAEGDDGERPDASDQEEELLGELAAALELEDAVQDGNGPMTLAVETPFEALPSGLDMVPVGGAAGGVHFLPSGPIGCFHVMKRAGGSHGGPLGGFRAR